MTLILLDFVNSTLSGVCLVFRHVRSGLYRFTGSHIGDAVLFSLHPLKCRTTLICPITVDSDIDHLITVLSAGFNPGEFLLFTFVINSIWHKPTLKLCKYCQCHHQTFHLFVYISMNSWFSILAIILLFILIL